MREDRPAPARPPDRAAGPPSPVAGRAFRRLVYEVVRRIPRGRVATYGQVAILAGFPRRARHVGQALARLPAEPEIPWHRVINAQGRISTRSAGRRPGASPRKGNRRPGEAERRQQRLLEREGVRFREGRVDFSRHGWHPALDHD